MSKQAIVYNDGENELALFTLDAETVDYWEGVCQFHDALQIEERGESLPTDNHDGEYELVYVTQDDEGNDVVQNLRMVSEEERADWEERIEECSQLRVQEFIGIDYSSVE